MKNCFLIFVLALCVVGCSQQRPRPTPRPLPIPSEYRVLRLRPVILTDGSDTSRWDADSVAEQLAALDFVFTPAKLRVRVLPLQWRENPELVEIESRSEWIDLCYAAYLDRANRGEHTVFYVGGLPFFHDPSWPVGWRCYGVAQFPDSYLPDGVAVAARAPTLVTVHEVGHSFGLRHVDEDTPQVQDTPCRSTRDCAVVACAKNLESYCWDLMTPEITPDQAKWMQWWLTHEPRTQVLESAPKPMVGAKRVLRERPLRIDMPQVDGGP